MKPFSKILVPTDFSKGADAALERALELRKRYDASITLLHTYELPVAYVQPAAMLGDLPTLIERAARDQMEKTRAIAERGARELSPVGPLPRIDSSVAPGTPAQSITSAASDGSYDLIVMGTHGRTGISHALIGSVAERVVRTASCPVLTVRYVP